MLSSSSKINLGRTCHRQMVVGTSSWMIGARQSQRHSNVTQRCYATLLRGGKQQLHPQQQPQNLQCCRPAPIVNSTSRSKLSHSHHRHHPPQPQRRRWLSTRAAETEPVVEPTYEQLKMVALAQAIPFVGFGIMDNSILIIAGDAIDTSLGVMLGISTMCAAAIGNIISDVAGIMLGTVVEDFVARWANLPSPNLSNAQRSLRSVRFANQFGCGTGIVIGCIIGMFPLLYIDSHKIERMKREKHIENIFRDVVTEAKTLIGAESTCLYVRVRKEENDADKKKKKDTKVAKVNSQTEYEPAADGDYLYAMYYAVPQGSVGAGVVEGGNIETGSGGRGGSSSSLSSSSSSNTHAEISSTDTKTSSLVKRLTAGGSVGTEHLSEVMPLGKGITSRAILTREPWNIENVHAEPDFINPGPGKPQNVRHMVVVPVLDAHGNAIAVIQGINKLRKPEKEMSLFSKLVSGRDLEDQQAAAAATATTTSSSSSSSNKGFTDHDVQILMALASHISVGLQQSMYRDPDEEAEVRLRDTIRILKEHGLAGITANEDDDEEGAKGYTEKDRDQAAAASSHRRRRRLFPED